MSHIHFTFPRQTIYNRIFVQVCVRSIFSATSSRPSLSLRLRPHHHNHSTTMTTMTTSIASHELNLGTRLPSLTRVSVIKFSASCKLTSSNVKIMASTNYQRGSRHKESNKKFVPGNIMAMGALSFLFKKKEEDSIETTIKRAVLQERKGHVLEAEKLLHQALDMSLKDKNQQAVTYIYDQMANMLLRHDKLEQAESSFKETLRRLISSGTDKTDPSIIEISLKLAQIYSATKRVSEAQLGFQWCIETTEAIIKDTDAAADAEQYMNLKALLGMCLEGYARHLTRFKQFDAAENCYLRALAICEVDLMADGKPHHESVTIINDLGTLYDMKGQYKKARDHIRKSAKLAQRLGLVESLTMIWCNLASVEAHLGNNGEAKRLFKKALKEAEHQDNARSILIIKNKLAQLETDILLQKK